MVWRRRWLERLVRWWWREIREVEVNRRSHWDMRNRYYKVIDTFLFNFWLHKMVAFGSLFVVKVWASFLENRKHMKFLIT
ncbi:hypothetical protein CXB51_005915 [Gossypium anomalum]|uniref:Uncharacterized protein n=1 Tax=Gossypium anomalum TaxID=47600 RepID=A0A8J5ZXB6_9ROSI|nr:hypothetical protein CXB51_005915 [Gossypium anomalum]